ncbi:beta-lactamase [Candidatus Acidianus copahuensis]|uniref:Beta-lactamase n=1 Tax=Candidatus Acidianus copahuensis TaxID=1160895 RepID=A0A031LRR9_9CREN|nr:MBL fold metallo-hydrolase [Candidatus Acidianus copahuensis]EZQ11062.1 beta-lactamase [Candidatus Acidianus copahuensis]
MPCKGIHEVPAGPVEFPELVYSFVICDEKTVMIDAGVANSVMDVSFLDKIDYIVLTHIHLDHIGLLPDIISNYKPKIIIKEGYTKFLEEPRKINDDARKVLGDLVDIYGEVNPVKGEYLEVKGGEKIKIGNNTMEIISTPGHSRHHISVFVDGVLYSGDSVGGRYNGVPYVTTPPPLDLQEYRRSLSLQLSLRPRLIGLSHGGFVQSSHLEEVMKILENGKKPKIEIGGIAESILEKHLDINYTELEEKRRKKN